MLCDDGRRGRDFHLLKNFRLAAGRDEFAAAVRAAVERVGLEMIDRLGRKWRLRVLLVSRLPALLPLLAPVWAAASWA
jgi:hypothetical protein